jgi:lysophospholipase L1-like esterase
LSGVVVCHGNSITRGAFSSSDAVWAYPAQLQRLLDLYDPDGDWTVHNEGTDGIQTPALTSEFAAVVHPRAGAGANVVIFHEATNHIKNGGKTAAEALAAVRAYCEAATVLGWTVYVCTGTPRNDAIQPTYDAFNALLRIAAPSFSAALIDLAAHPTLTDPTDRRYFHGDGTHFIDAGFTQIAEASLEPFVPGRIAQRDREVARYRDFLSGATSGTITASELTETDVDGEVFLSWE